MLINDNWKVESDTMNVILYKRTDPSSTHGIAKQKADAKKQRLSELGDDEPSEPGWRVEGYYGTVAGALESLVTKEVLITGFESLQLLNARIDAITEDIRQVLGKLRKVPKTD
jgi:hypothetical protein